MPIKALNDRKKLSSDFNEANDAFIDASAGSEESLRLTIAPASILSPTENPISFSTPGAARNDAS